METKKCYRKHGCFAVIVLAVLVMGSGYAQAEAAAQAAGSRWVGTWATSAQEVEAKLMPSEFQNLGDTTLRQVVRVSAGGSKLRVRFSNAFADWSDNLQISEACVAVSAGGNAIVSETARPLMFSGKPSVTVPYGTLLLSDPIEFDLKPGSDLAVTIHVAKAPRKTTGHRSARGEAAWMQSGNAVTGQDLPASVPNTCWYYLCGVDVLASKPAAAVVCLGDSITDGKGSTEGTNRRWPDYLAQRLQANPETAHLGVLNQGIGGNCLWAGGIGQTVLQRLERDVLAQPSARWVIVLEGINDLGGGKTSVEEIITSFEQIIARSQACGLRVYGSTILPCGESFYFNPALEAKRQKINEWIRTGGAFDAVIDWDAVVRDPQNPARLRPEADSGDHLHLSDEGYRLMAEAVGLNLFDASERSAGNSSIASPELDRSNTLPAVSELPSIPKLPDPFKFMDGRPVTLKEDWPRRRAEISRLVQEYVYGPLPPKPATVTGALSENSLTVNCSEKGKSISFSVKIEYPTTGKAPYPAMISIGPWLTLPKSELDNLGIAILYFPNDELGRQGGAHDRGKGKFYDLYGADHPAGSLMAWAWGVSRLIDVLEQVPDACIDPARLGVTGCSRNGKGALVCGGLDERIALTVPTESGAGGSSSWRVADAMLASGRNVQTARQIVTENTWMAPAFVQFGHRVDRLPVDQHLVAALCAPRPLLITDNTAMEWLGPEAGYTTAVAARKVWQALGVPDRMGFVQTSHGDHCRFKEIDELRAFCVKYLLDGEADTNLLKTDGDFDLDPSEWIDWEVPALK